MMIAICEDEEKVRTYILGSFQLEGYSVIETASVPELITTLTINKNIELLILDRLVENLDSAKFIKNILELAPQIKILILSAIDTPEQKANLLDLGADDYLSKPFSLVELHARVRSLIKKSRESKFDNELISCIEIKNLKVDRIKHNVSVNLKSLDLSNKEYQLLILFCEHPGRIYNKYQLLDMVWCSQFDIESNVVEVTIKNLRKKLTAANSEVTIESRRQVGYWIEK